MTSLRGMATAASLLVLAGCHPEGRPPGITVLIESPPDSLDDRLALSANGERLAELIAPGLVTFDDESRPVPNLAASFEWTSPVTLEVRLRPGLRFHDGSPLTADDVKATYDGILSVRVPSAKREKFTAIRDVVAVDPLTVRFELAHPYAPLLSEMGLSIVPRARAAPPGAEAQDRAPIGAGAFRFASQPDDEHLELEAFDGYWAGAPKIRALHVRVVRDETTRVLELLKGRADLAINAVSPEVLPQLDGKNGLRVLTTPGTAFQYVAFNVRKGPLADKRVRKALCRLVDVAPIVQYKFHGLAQRATGLLAQNHWAYAATPGCTPDPAEAAHLLDAAGYPAPPGGGPRLRLSYKTSTDRFRKSVALVLKEQLERGGVEVDLRSLEFGTLFNDVRNGDFEMYTLKWSVTFEPDLLRQVFSSTQVPTPANHFGGLNRGGYSNLGLDALLAAAAEAPADERRGLYAKALAQLDDDVPVIPLWHEDSVAVVSRHLAGFKPSAQGFLSGLAAAEEVPWGAPGGRSCPAPERSSSSRSS